MNIHGWSGIVYGEGKTIAELIVPQHTCNPMLSSKQWKKYHATLHD